MGKCAELQSNLAPTPEFDGAGPGAATFATFAGTHGPGITSIKHFRGAYHERSSFHAGPGSFGEIALQDTVPACHITAAPYSSNNIPLSRPPCAP
jgi:hypothetical protein